MRDDCTHFLLPHLDLYFTDFLLHWCEVFNTMLKIQRQISPKLQLIEKSKVVYFDRFITVKIAKKSSELYGNSLNQHSKNL